MSEKCCERTIEQMTSDLRGGGWLPVSRTVWQAPCGGLYRGPHKAWHIWAGTPMKDINARDGSQ